MNAPHSRAVSAVISQILARVRGDTMIAGSQPCAHNADRRPHAVMRIDAGHGLSVLHRLVIALSVGFCLTATVPTASAASARIARAHAPETASAFSQQTSETNKIFAAANLPAPARRAELIALVREDCGACHGLSLSGGLGTPLTPAALSGKDAEQLVQTILKGRPGTAMPPWQPFLNEAEAQWVVEQLRQGFPER